MLGRLDSANTDPSDRMAANQYRAFCLLALGRMSEAERAIEAVLTVDLLYRPADAPCRRACVRHLRGVRQRILPSIVQQEYTRARTAFDRGDFPSAVAQFDRVLKALADPDLGAAAGKPPLVDLPHSRGWLSGFERQSCCPSTGAAATPARRGGGRGPTVGGPSTAAQNQVCHRRSRCGSRCRRIQGDMSALREGILELIVNEVGEVEWAAMRTPITSALRLDAVSCGKKLEVPAGDPEWHARQGPQIHQRLDQTACQRRLRSRDPGEPLTSQYRFGIGLHWSVELIRVRLARERRQFERLAGQRQVGRMVEQVANEIEPSTPLIVEIDGNPGRVRRVRGLEHGITRLPVLDVAPPRFEIDR